MFLTCVCFTSTHQEVCIWHVQFLGLKTSPTTWISAAGRWWWGRAVQVCQVRDRIYLRVNRIMLTLKKKRYIHIYIYLFSCCHCRRASMELPLAVRFKQLKATSKETVGVYRLDQWGSMWLSVITDFSWWKDSHWPIAWTNNKYVVYFKVLKDGFNEHTKSLKTWIISLRLPVPLCRSPIHGRGLFCKKTIEAGEMVIEYSGNVIRSVLTDKREKYYDGKVRSWSTRSVCLQFD